MELTLETKSDDIDKIDIYHDSYHDAVIKIVYETARDCQFLWYTYEYYRKKTEKYSDVLYDSWFVILWNLAINYNRKNYPCHMEDLADIQERELAEKDLSDDFIMLWIDDS